VRTKPFDRIAAPLAVLVLLLAMVIAFAAGCGSSTVVGKGKPAPDFSGTTLDGQSVSLSMYRGKPLVLAFMASW
jgi:cytochrome c biogenesis protein CcmG, thiol:disulfide interchange protein DsbE